MAILLKLPFCTEDPANNRNIITMPLVHRKHPRKTWGFAIRALALGGGGAGRIPASWPRSRSGKRWGTTTCSPRARGRPGFERRWLRRGRVATAGGGGRDGCGSGEGGAMSSNGWQHKLLVNLGSSLGRSENTGESWRGEFTGGRQWRARWSGRSGGGLAHARGEWTALNRVRARP
jgi:hypothetical protein